LNARLGLIPSAAVARLSTRWITALVLSALVATLVHAQVSDEEKRKRAEFLKTKQEQSDSSESAEESPTPRPKSAKPKKSPTPAPRKSPAPTSKAKKKKATDEAEATPKKKSTGPKNATPSKKKATPQTRSTPKHEDRSGEERATPAPQPSETPVARATVLPRAIAVPTPAAPPAPIASSSGNATTEEPAELTIEKTGYEKRTGFWYRFFHGNGSTGGSGSGAGYRYLTRSVRAEIDRAPADRRNPQWQFIVVHNSGTRQGNAKVFDYYHRHVRHMQNGLAYHFVIGNGTSTGNGLIEVGDRWRRQINGGHVHSDNLNNIALGICLVGDFNRSQPTSAQLQSCEELIRYLRQRCGKVGNHYMLVKPHREMNPPRWATDCPGDAFPYSWFRRFQE
jgi:hypothetical protein